MLSRRPSNPDDRGPEPIWVLVPADSPFFPTSAVRTFILPFSTQKGSTIVLTHLMSARALQAIKGEYLKAFVHKLWLASEKMSEWICLKCKREWTNESKIEPRNCPLCKAQTIAKVNGKKKTLLENLARAKAKKENNDAHIGLG